MPRMGRGFWGGLAHGAATGVRLGLEMDEADERKKDRALERERVQLGLEAARRERGYDDEVSALIDRYQGGSAAGDAYDEGAEVDRRPGARREMTLADQINMHRDLGALAFKHRKLSQAEFLALPQQLRVAQKEGVMQALDEMASTGDMKAGIAAFNKLGGVRIKAYTTRQAIDPLTGLPDTEITMRTEDDQHKTMSLAKLARSAGTAKEYIEWSKLGESARARAAAERKNDLTEARDAARGEYEGRMANAADRRAGAAERTAAAAERRADNPLANSRQAAWAEARKKALIGVGYSETDATTIAYGGRQLSARDARAKAEQLAASAKDDAGQPLSPQAKKRVADQVYQRIMAVGAPEAPEPGLTPTPGAVPAAPPKPINLNDYVIGR